MEVINVNNSGLFEVRLGGVVFDNCTVDADCPGRAYCGVNETWSARPSMCYCDFIYDHTGALCETSTGFGWAYYAGHIIACFVTTAWCIVGLYDLGVLIKWKRFTTDALSTSLIFGIFGTFWTTILTGAATRFTIQVLAPNAQGSKQDTSAIGRVALVFTFLFSTLALLNVSLVWLEVAENAGKMQKSQSSNVSTYKKFLYVYYTFFMGLIVISLVLGDFLFAAAAALPGTLFIIVTYMVGYFKMRKMMLMYLSSEGSSSNQVTSKVASSKETTKKLRTSMKAIKLAALGVSLSSLTFIVFMGVWILLGGFLDEPNSGFNIVAVSLAWIGVASGLAFVMDYIHGAVTRKIHALEKSSADHSIVAMDHTATDTPARRVTGMEGSFKQPRGGASADVSVSSPHVRRPSDKPSDQHPQE